MRSDLREVTWHELFLASDMANYFLSPRLPPPPPCPPAPTATWPPTRASRPPALEGRGDHWQHWSPWTILSAPPLLKGRKFWNIWSTSQHHYYQCEAWQRGGGGRGDVWPEWALQVQGPEVPPLLDDDHRHLYYNNLHIHFHFIRTELYPYWIHPQCLWIILYLVLTKFYLNFFFK